ADHKAAQRAVERHSGVEEEVAGNEVVPDALEHRAERRQHIGRERARARRKLPGEGERKDGKHPRKAPTSAPQPTRGSWLVLQLSQGPARHAYSCHRSILCMTTR